MMMGCFKSTIKHNKTTDVRNCMPGIGVVMRGPRGPLHLLPYVDWYILLKFSALHWPGFLYQ